MSPEPPAPISGNAAAASQDTRGWFLGHFMPGADNLLRSSDLELKWYTHAKGETRADWAPATPVRTLNILIRGRFALVFPDDFFGFMLLRPGFGFRPAAVTVPQFVMQNENVVDFQRYAVAHTCWFLDLTERLLQLLIGRWGIPQLDGVRSSGGAIEWFNGGVAQLREFLRSEAVQSTVAKDQPESHEIS